MLAAAFVLAYLASIKGSIGRRSGVVLLASYALYVVVLFAFPEGGAPALVAR